jgi:glycosyltransferase involved in cell wall biosynthesis
MTNTGLQGLSATLAKGKLARLQRWVHRQVSACVAVSDEAAAEAAAFGISRRLIVNIPNGVDVSRFAPVNIEERERLKQKLGFDTTQRIALFAGRMVEQKNPLQLLEAWAILKPSLTVPWILVMAGDGPLREAIEKRIGELNLHADVVLVGEVKDMTPLFGVSDLYVLSSENEGMANSLLEAMAFGLASVVTPVSGTNQLVEEPRTGLIAPIGRPEALASALLTLQADQKLREEMGQRARNVIVQQFAIAKVAAQHIQLYEKLTNGAING